MEIGWPSAGKSSEAQRAAFVKRLPDLMGDVSPRILTWSLLVVSQNLVRPIADAGTSCNRLAPLWLCPSPPFKYSSRPFAGWLSGGQQDVIGYLVEENRVLRAQLRGRRLRLTDDQRHRLRH